MPEAPAGPISVKAPVPGGCRICGVVHAPDKPHDRDSLYYQNRFYRRYRRFPTWEDAMAHCTEEVKAAARAELKKRGIE